MRNGFNILFGITILASFISCGNDKEYNDQLKRTIEFAEVIPRNCDIAVRTVNFGYQLSFQTGKPIDESSKSIVNASLEGIYNFNDSIKQSIEILKKSGEGKESYKEFVDIYGDIVELTGLLKGGNLDVYNNQVAQKSADIKKKLELFKLKYLPE